MTGRENPHLWTLKADNSNDNTDLTVVAHPCIYPGQTLQCVVHSFLDYIYGIKTNKVWIKKLEKTNGNEANGIYGWKQLES